MITYKLASYRPPAYRPAAKLGQDGAVRAAAVGVNLIMTALAAGTTWVGLDAGINGKGFIRVVGWITGIAAGLATLTHLAGTVGVALLPLPKSSSVAPDVYTAA